MEFTLTGLANLIRALTPILVGGDKGPLVGGADNRQIVADLRAIYFSPNGVRRLLEKIANGDAISESEAQAILTEFNDAEYHLGQHLHDIVDFWDAGPKHLTLRQREALQGIGWNKYSVRRKVQDVVNYLDRNDPYASANEAARLLDEIEALNSAIMDAEEALINQRQSK